MIKQGRSPRILVLIIELLVVLLMLQASARAQDIDITNQLQTIKLRRYDLPTGSYVGVIFIGYNTTPTQTLKVHAPSSPIWQIELRSLDDPTLPTVRIPSNPNPYIAYNPSMVPVIPVPLVPSNRLSITGGGGSAAITWTLDPLTGDNTTNQTITVTVSVTMRGGVPESDWSISVTLSDTNPSQRYGVYATRFPFFAFDPIDSDQTDDAFLVPAALGSELRDPIRYEDDHRNFTSERDKQSIEATTEDAIWTYPGNLFSQFYAYYDDTVGIDNKVAGLMVRAEDFHGISKNIYFNVGDAVQPATRRVLYAYFTHFNKQDANPDGNPDFSDYLSFSLADGFYAMIVRADPFQTAGASDDLRKRGWYRAAELYRAWAAPEAGPVAPFIPNDGTASRLPVRFRQRSDIQEADKLAAYNFRYQLKHAPLSDLAVDVSNTHDYDRIKAVLEFYRSVFDRYDPRSMSNPGFYFESLRPNIAITNDRYDPCTNLIFPGVGGGGDQRSLLLREGVAALLYKLKHPPQGDIPVRACGQNKDSTGIPSTLPPNCSVTPTRATILQNGVISAWRLSPTMALFPAIDSFTSTNVDRTCIGSPWLLNERIQRATTEIEDSLLSNEYGYTRYAFTGDGNASFPCFAPAVTDGSVNRMQHNHRIGGGGYQTNAWESISTTLRGMSQYQDQLFGMELAPETMLPYFLLSGRNYSEPYDISSPGANRRIVGAEQVPLFTALYHDFNLHIAEVTPFQDFINRYYSCWNADSMPNPPWLCDSMSAGPSLADNYLLRYRSAKLALHGRQVSMQLSQNEMRPAEDVRFALDPVFASTFAFRDEHEFFAALAALRAGIPEYLVYGSMLPDPKVTATNSADTNTLWYMESAPTVKQLTVPRAVAAAWGGLDSMGASLPPSFAVVNFTPTVVSVRLDFNPSLYGLNQATTYKIQRKDSILPEGSGGNWCDVTAWGTFMGSATMHTSPAFLVAPVEGNGSVFKEPWKLFRIVPVSQASCP